MSLLTKDEHAAALIRIDALMNAKPDTPEIVELDALVNQVVDYEALHDATDALIVNMLAATAVRRNPKLREMYFKRAECCVRAWLKARSAQGVKP